MSRANATSMANSGARVNLHSVQDNPRFWVQTAMLAAVVAFGFLNEAVAADLAGTPATDRKCSISDRLPERYDVFHVGTYAGTSNMPEFIELDDSGHDVRKVDVVVNQPGQPVVLVLTAYDPVVWNVAWTPGSSVVGVVVSGYHGQAIVGIPKSIPLLLTTYENSVRKLTAQRGCGYFYSYQVDRDYPGTAKKIATMTGREVTRFVRARDKSVTIVGVGPPQSWSNLVSSADYKLSDFAIVRAPEEVPAGKRGLEELVRKGYLRPATEADIRAWQDEASVDLKRYDPAARVGFMRGVATYVVLKPVTLPDGLYGGHSVTFLIPKGVPMPAGPHGHNTFYVMGESRCTGPGC